MFASRGLSLFRPLFGIQGGSYTLKSPRHHTYELSHACLVIIFLRTTAAVTDMQETTNSGGSPIFILKLKNLSFKKKFFFLFK